MANGEPTVHVPLKYTVATNENTKIAIMMVVSHIGMICVTLSLHKRLILQKVKGILISIPLTFWRINLLWGLRVTHIIPMWLTTIIIV